MLGSSCHPCCGSCSGSYPSQDPKNEGNWTPSGSWKTGITWTFTANPGDESGKLWYFKSSSTTSTSSGTATTTQMEDWGNICNWWCVNGSTSPTFWSLTNAKRASRLPDETAHVFVLSPVTTASLGPSGATVAAAYFYADHLAGSKITTTETLLDAPGGAIFYDCFNSGTVDGGAVFDRVTFTVGLSGNAGGATVNGGARFYRSAINGGTVTGGAKFFGADAVYITGTISGGVEFNEKTFSGATVYGGATFNNESYNYYGTVYDGAVFNGTSRNEGSTVYGGATFNSGTSNTYSTVNGGATFNGGRNLTGGIVNGGATFNSGVNNGLVNGGAVFNGSSTSGSFAEVTGGATFNDTACSFRKVTSGGVTRFVVHPTDLPTCSGSAQTWVVSTNKICGCG